MKEITVFNYANRRSLPILLDPIFIELDFLNRKLAKISEFY